MNFKALLKSNKKLIFKFCLLIGCFLIMTLFIFNNESFYKRTIINITDISTSNEVLIQVRPVKQKIHLCKTLRQKF